MKKPFLTVVLRDPGPMTFYQEPPSHRTVRIDFTPEQLEKLKLRKVGVMGTDGTGKPFELFEEFSSAFIELEDDDRGNG